MKWLRMCLIKLDGFLNIDKPEGITSFDVIRKLRKICPSKTKMGHLGTLDPIARGVLPVALGKATKVIEYIRDEKKVYIAELILGAVSDTEDSSGNITYTGSSAMKENDLLDILESFIGTIEQIPPMYSAIHHEGKRLYELARQGVTVERAPRKIEIFSLKLLSQNQDDDLPRLTIEVSCSKGTYIRSLCRDIGEKLGTGAYMSGLIRKKSGIFEIEDSCKLEKILNDPDEIDSLLYPVDFPLQEMPGIKLASAEEENMVINGRIVRHNENISSGRVRIYSPNDYLLAIGEINIKDGIIFVQPKKVFKPN